ncbi:MAG: CapA family protein [Muribaculaceae bacterium]|nr:CapA family protein [Muribaculaceae bacterium]
MKRLLTIVMLAALLAACSGENTASGDTAVAGDSTATAPDTLTIAMTGDIMLGSTFPRVRLPRNDGRDIFIECDSILRAADVACGNLEGVLADEGRPRKNPESPRAFMFLMPTEYVGRLVDAGYDFLGIANNHIFDFWEEGAVSTTKTLQEAGIAYAGRKECEQTSRTINGVRYGFCAFGHEDYCLRTQDTATVRRIITELKRDNDIVIVCFHGGAEGTACRHLPYETEYLQGDDRGNLRVFTHFAVDCGASIVYGHGPHVPRCMELYKGHLIAYSLGNFATPVGMGTAGLTGYAPLLVARLNSLTGEFIDGKIHSFIQIAGEGPRRDHKNLVAAEIRQLTEEDITDNHLLIADDGTITIKQ